MVSSFLNGDFMFVRTKKRRVSGEIIEYAYLVRNEWTQKGPRQKIINYLGRVFSIEEDSMNNSIGDGENVRFFGINPGEMLRLDFQEAIRLIINNELLKLGFERIEELINESAIESSEYYELKGGFVRILYFNKGNNKDGPVKEQHNTTPIIMIITKDYDFYYKRIRDWTKKTTNDLVKFGIKDFSSKNKNEGKGGGWKGFVIRNNEGFLCEATIKGVLMLPKRLINKLKSDDWVEKTRFETKGLIMKELASSMLECGLPANENYFILLYEKLVNELKREGVNLEA